MSNHHSLKEIALAKRIFFLILSFVITCSTQIKENEANEIPKFTYARLDNEINLLVQDAGQLLPDANAEKPGCEIY